MTAGVLMPDIDVDSIQDAATKKVGPLPAWGWAFVAVGAFVAYRLVSGPRSATVSQAEGGASGGPGVTDTSGSGGPDFEGPNSLIQRILDTLSEQAKKITALQTVNTAQSKALTNVKAVNTQQASLIQQLQTSAASLGSTNELLIKLQGLLSQRSTLLYNRNAFSTNLNTYRDSLAKCTTQACRDKYNGLIASTNTKITQNTTQLATLDKAIADLQKQLQG